MSRIDEAWRRVTGATEQPRPTSGERFRSERTTARAEGLDNLRPVRRDETNRIERPAAPRGVLTTKVPIIAGDPAPADSRPVSFETPSVPAERPARTTIDADPAAQADQLIDYRQIADYLGFVVRSLNRHRLLGGATFAFAFATTIALALAMPKTYYIQAKLLAQRNAVMTALSNPGRAVPWDADAPTRAAAETVFRRDNLTALIAELDLLNEWERRRTPVLKLKDWGTALLSGHTPSRAEKLDALVLLLEAQMKVNAGPVGDGTVTIELWWPHADVGYRIVQTAQKAFLEARQVAETAAISESIGILERYSASLHQDIDRALTELQRETGRRTIKATRRVLASRSLQPLTALGQPPLDPSLEPDTELNKLKAEIAARRQELSLLEETRQRQIAELQGRLTQLTTVYSATHPNVMAVQQNLVALTHEPAQITNLKTDLKSLEADYEKRWAGVADQRIQAELARRTAAERDTARVATETLAPPAEPAEAEPASEVSELGTVLLRTELSQLESVLERTNGARIELAVSQAAFKYRYTVITPAQVPRDPVRPNVRMIIAAGLVGSLLLAFVTVVTKDLLSDRILETWQVQRQVGLPVLSTVKLG